VLNNIVCCGRSRTDSTAWGNDREQMFRIESHAGVSIARIG